MKKDLTGHDATEEGLSFSDIQDRKGAILAALGRRGWDVGMTGAELNIGGKPKDRRIVTVGFPADERYINLHLGWQLVHDERIAYAPNLWYLATLIDKIARSIPAGHGKNHKIGSYVPLPNSQIEAIRSEMALVYDKESQIAKTKPKAAGMGM